MKPKFAIGDIVAVEGYKDRIFFRKNRKEAGE